MYMYAFILPINKKKKKKKLPYGTVDCYINYLPVVSLTNFIISLSLCIATQKLLYRTGMG